MACLCSQKCLAFCGRRMRVAKVAHKTCDNIKKTGGRRMRNAVHLEGARCDGAAHGGCQADCVFFWKEAWLRRERDTAEVVSGSSELHRSGRHSSGQDTRDGGRQRAGLGLPDDQALRRDDAAALVGYQAVCP